MNCKIEIIARSVGKSLFKVKKHSPEILLVAGIVGAVGGCVMACKATLKAGEVLDEAKERIDEVHEIVVNTDEGTYLDGVIGVTKDEYKKELAIAYIQAIVSFAKLYGPAVAVELLSIISILASHNILHKRSVALAAAYATIDKSFKEYRGRVFEKFGKEIEREIRYDLKDEIEEHKIVNEAGSETTEKTIRKVAKSKPSGYSRYFGKYTEDYFGNKIRNTEWDSSGEYNFIKLKQAQSSLNDRLRIKGFIYLNEVYDALGMGPTKAGQRVGWIYDPENPAAHYIDFGLFKNGNSATYDYYSDSIEGPYHEILIELEPDGDLWEML